jgi:hypothetical protein
MVWRSALIEAMDPVINEVVCMICVHEYCSRLYKKIVQTGIPFLAPTVRIISTVHPSLNIDKATNRYGDLN